MDDFVRVDPPPAGYGDGIPTNSFTCLKCGSLVAIVGTAQHDEMHSWMDEVG